MAKITGLLPTAFDTKDGNHISGMSIYTSEPIDPKRGQGESFEKFFLSDAKLALLDFKLEIGSDITILYNKFGRVQTIKLNDEFEIQ